METVSYSDFSMELHKRVVSSRVPLNGMIEVTRHCPLKCVHCYNNLSSAEATPESELTYEEHCRILDEMTEAGCLWLLFTGGEIFARKDFLKIYTYAKKKGLIVTLFTNGTLIDKDVADTLADWRPFLVEITIYGRTKETFDRITGVPGSYDRCMRGIHLLMERRIPLKLKTMALRINKDEIWEMKRFAEEELGLKFRFDPIINPRIDYKQDPLNLRLTPREIVEMDLRDPKRLADWKTLAARSVNATQAQEIKKELYYCNGGVTAFTIDPYGKMGLCMLSTHDRFDLRHGSFKEGWNNHLFGIRKKKVTKQTKCVACRIKIMCGMCPPSGDLENRDPEEPVDFFCQLAHLRAYTFGVSIPAHGDCEYCNRANVLVA
jgi:radical SAM protein with 4Fe4S-binding SPASM domain